MTKFIVVATLTDSTPFEVLYGDNVVAFDDEALAQAQADDFNDECLWGKHGDLTPAQDGWSYEVQEVEEDEIAEGGEYAAWGA